MIGMEGHGILSTIGRTPLIRLSKLFPGRRGIRVYAKLETFNPTGSAKDRPALHMIRDAWNQGAIGPGSVIIESSSGNMAISLASICLYLGMRFICVIDPKTTEQNIKILRAYGAEIDYIVEPDAATGEYLQARLKRVKELVGSTPNSFWPNQYANPGNPLSHEETTMQEIIDALGSVDYVIGGVSTCGTMYGCARHAKDRGMPVRFVGVDAEGSVMFGGQRGYRRFPGLGAGIVPPFAERTFLDHVIRVTDWEMVTGCRRLIRQESVFVGPSSGGVVEAMRTMETDIEDDSVCVVIFHDRGERYLDTVYSDDWVQSQFGQLPDVML